MDSCLRGPQMNCRHFLKKRAKGASRIELRSKIKLKPNDREFQALCSFYHCSICAAPLYTELCARMMNAIVIFFYSNE